MSTIAAPAAARTPLAAVAFFLGAAAILTAVLSPGLGMIAGMVAALCATAASLRVGVMPAPARVGYGFGLVAAAVGIGVIAGG